MLKASSLLAFLFLLAAPQIGFADDGAPGSVNVRELGAKCNGQSDDTEEFRKAIEKAGRSAGVVFVPPGRCVISDTLVVAGVTPVSFVGAGRGSQVYMRENKTLIHYTGVNAISVQNLYLGSSATAPGTSLLKLTNSHHNRIDNVTMLGSNIGVHLEGSLLNTIVDLRSGTNFQGFFASTSVNAQWVLAERFNNISANANTFVAPVLEGGINGVWLRDSTNSEGSLNITGGSIEGLSGVALRLQSTFLPTVINAVHFEANGGGDLIIENSSNVLRITGILATTIVSITNSHPAAPAASFTRNITITDSAIERVDIAQNTKRIRLLNITTNLANCGPPSGVNNLNVTPGAVVIDHVGNNCGNQ